MIYTVSTIKDTQPNLDRFIGRNLRAGADHLFIFLEGPDAAAQSRRIASRHVTTIVPDERYWGGPPPLSLNARQTINANLVNCLLAPFEWAGWLFHIDGDECLHIDKAYLRSLDAGVHCVRAMPLEAVSQRDAGAEVTRFKRKLSAGELEKLHRLGMIDTARNRAYFRGHVLGKSGIRPSPFLSLRVHDVKTPNHAVLRDHRSDRIRMLHYESTSAADFIRKWKGHHGAPAARRPEQNATRLAVSAVLDSRMLSDQAKQEQLLGIYRRHIEDDVDTLESLGFLVTPDRRRHRYRPQAHTPWQADLIRQLLDVLLVADKRHFRPSNRRKVARDLLRSISVIVPDEGLAKRVRWSLAR